MTVTLADLVEATHKNGENIAQLNKGLTNLVDAMTKSRAPGHPSPEQVFGVPNVRRGEDVMTSRGFSFLKMLGMLTNAVNREHASVEWGLHEKMHKCLDAYCPAYSWGGAGVTGFNRFLAPLSTDYLPLDMVGNDLRVEAKQLVQAGAAGADPNEVGWVRQKMLAARGYGSKALSWLNELTGGALVPPPEQGELIELLRNKEALVNAGARTVPLPPQGRIKYPRQTGASTTYWVGESAPIPESTPGTGEVTLQAKKLAVRIIAPNELIRFASPAAEAILRDDMTKSLALALDMAGLEGAGGDTRPRGVINTQNITRLNSSDQRANGDAMVGRDFYRMIAAVEESNAEAEGFIMRPKTLYRAYQLRADAVAQGDAAGPWLFNLIREAGDGIQATIAGLPVTKSTQVSQVRAKGTSTSLTYMLCGKWSDVLIGMFGAIEFASTTVGDTAFTNDQTWVRGILSADIAFRHEASFSMIDNIDVTI